MQAKNCCIRLTTKTQLKLKGVLNIFVLLNFTFENLNKVQNKHEVRMLSVGTFVSYWRHQFTSTFHVSALFLFNLTENRLPVRLWKLISTFRANCVTRAITPSCCRLAHKFIIIIDIWSAVISVDATYASQGGGRGVLSIMAYTRRLHPKGIPF